MGETQAPRGFTRTISRIEPVVNTNSPSGLSAEHVMNYEQIRLDTFKNWPPNAPVSANKIAKAGFFYLGIELTVKCFSCKVVISVWKFGDQPITRHRTANPNCYFVCDRSNNVPIVGPTSIFSLPHLPQNEQASQNDQAPKNTVTKNHQHRVASQKVWTTFAALMQSKERLKTFLGWPVDFISPDDLAEAGFFYLRSGDLVQCILCDGRVGDWELGDVPMVEHKRHYPRCPIIVGPDEPERQPHLRPSLNEQPQSPSPQQNVGPKQPKYCTVQERLKTFNSWNTVFPVQPPELADAGFYYAGRYPISDHVRCFYCDGGLRNWEPGDDCWTQHALWFGNCAYLLHTKGQQFVDEIHRRYLPELLQVESKTASDKTTEEQIQNYNHFATAPPEDVVNFPEITVPKRYAEEELEEPSANLVHKYHQQNGPVVPLEFSTRGVECQVLRTYNNEGAVALGSETKEQEIPSKETEIPMESSSAEEDSHLCKICMDEPLAMVFLPCGHLVTCVKCGNDFKTCPFCRKEISQVVRTFIS